jgi:hypothetical protein
VREAYDIFQQQLVVGRPSRNASRGNRLNRIYIYIYIIIQYYVYIYIYMYIVLIVFVSAPFLTFPPPSFRPFLTTLLCSSLEDRGRRKTKRKWDEEDEGSKELDADSGGIEEEEGHEELCVGKRGCCSDPQSSQILDATHFHQVTRLIRRNSGDQD